MTGIEKVFELAGGPLALAKKLNVTHQAVYNWRVRGYVPATRAMQLEKMFDVQREELVSPALLALLT